MRRVPLYCRVAVELRTAGRRSMVRRLMRRTRRAAKFATPQVACVAAAALLMSPALAQDAVDKTVKDAGTSVDSAAGAQGSPPNRPSKSLFHGEQGRQRTEISFDPSTKIVAVKLVVQDPHGYFISNIRDNFAVYENGVRQQNATVEIEHAAATVGLLIKSGGRYAALDLRLFGKAASRTANQFLGEIGRNDRVAIWKYGDKVEQLCDFSQGYDTLRGLLSRLLAAPVSELNFYDALIFTPPPMQTHKGSRPCF